MKKKRILILVNHEIVIYNFRKELVEQLIEEKHTVIVSSPYGEKIPKLISLGCEFEDVKINRHGFNPFVELKLLFTYFKLIKDKKPDVILTYTIKPNIYGGLVAAFLKVPYIANITGLGSAVENKGFLQIISVLLYKIAFSKIQTVFFQNEENQQFFLNRKIAVGKHRLLPGSGVNLEHFGLIEYPDSDKEVNFVFISRIMKEKGIDQYLAAALHIKKIYPYVNFHVCGFCEERYEDILSVYHDKGIIIYHGMVEDIRNILKDMHCTIHPTYYPEGLSNVLLESAASGRPLISTNRSGCKEVIDNEINGYLIDEKNTDQLIHRIEQFLELSHYEKKQMGIFGRLKVEKQFNRQEVVTAYLQEIES